MASLLRKPLRPLFRAPLHATGDPAAPSAGGGAGFPISTPSVSVVEPVTNPPAFDILLPVSPDPKPVAEGDYIELRVDGSTVYTSDALTSDDIDNGTIELSTGDWTAGDHTVDVRVKRPVGFGNYVYSAWSAVEGPFTVPSAEEAETTALVGRFTTPPTTERRGQIDALIKSLKDAGVWVKLDALYLLAAADAQAAQRNWVADQYNLTPGNSPTFTADQGYTGNGSNTYLDTGLVLTDAVQYQQDSAHLSVYDLTSRGDANSAEIGVRGPGDHHGFVLTRYFGSLLAISLQIFGGGSRGATTPSSDGFALASRTSSVDIGIYRNGVLLGSSNDATSFSVPSTNSVYLLANNDGSGSPLIPTSDQLAVGSIGGGLDDTEAAAFNTAIQTYLTAVGAI